MERIWLKSYPAGVPADIDPGQYRSLIELFDANIARYRERPAFTNMGKTISFDELDKRSRDFGAWLQSRGLSKGARVAIMMPNCLQYPVVLYGTLRAGGIVVNVNPLYTPRELEHQLKDSGAEVIVILENFAATLEQVLPRTPVKHVVLAALGDMLGLKGTIFFTLRTTRFTIRPFTPSISPSEVTTTCLIGVRPRTSSSTWPKFSSTTMTSAPESFSWCSSSRGV